MIYLSNCKNRNGQIVSGRTWKPDIRVSSTNLPLIYACPTFCITKIDGNKTYIEPHLHSKIGVAVNYQLNIASDCYVKFDSSGSQTKGRFSLVTTNGEITDAFPSVTQFSNGLSINTPSFALGYSTKLISRISGIADRNYWYDTEGYRFYTGGALKGSIHCLYSSEVDLLVNEVAFVYCWNCEPIGLQRSSLNHFSEGYGDRFISPIVNSMMLDITHPYKMSYNWNLDGGNLKLGSVSVNSKTYDVYAVWVSKILYDGISIIDTVHVATNPMVWFKRSSGVSNLQMEAFMSYAAIEVQRY